METAGYIIGAINLVLTAVLALVRNVDDLAIDVRRAIQNELALNVRHLALDIDGADLSQMQNSSDRLSQLICGIVPDITRVSAVEFFQSSSMKLMFGYLLASVASILSGHAVTPESQLLLQAALFVILPFASLCSATWVLYGLLRAESYLKKTRAYYLGLNIDEKRS